MVFLKEFFQKVNFEKKSADNKIKHGKLPRMQNELTSFCGSAACFVSDLVRNPENLFSKDEAQKVLKTGEEH